MYPRKGKYAHDKFSHPQFLWVWRCVCVWEGNLIYYHNKKPLNHLPKVNSWPYSNISHDFKYIFIFSNWNLYLCFGILVRIFKTICLSATKHENVVYLFFVPTTPSLSPAIHHHSFVELKRKGNRKNTKQTILNTSQVLAGLFPVLVFFIFVVFSTSSSFTTAIKEKLLYRCDILQMAFCVNWQMSVYQLNTSKEYPSPVQFSQSVHKVWQSKWLKCLKWEDIEMRNMPAKQDILQKSPGLVEM